MTKEREALKLAREALEQSQQILDEYMTECVTTRQLNNDVITAIKEVLAQPEQEPVACIECERLRGALKRANDQAEHFEREWYLREDEIERMKAQPEQEPDEVDIRSRLYQRIDELEDVLRDIAEYTGEGPATTDYRSIVKLISDSARNALEESIDDGMCRACDGDQCTAKAGCVAISNPPPQRKPLTDEQIGDIAALFYAKWRGHEGFARAIEAAHGIKE